MGWRHFKRNKMAIFAPLISPHDSSKTNILKAKQSPSKEFLLGTDRVGSDILSRMLYGGRVSISVDNN